MAPSALLLAVVATQAATSDPCSVSGRVIDAATGAGVSGAEVWIDGSPERWPTAADGSFTIAEVPQHRIIVLDYGAAGYSPPPTEMSVIPTPGARLTGIELPLVAVPPLRVQVKSGGEPVAGAIVAIAVEDAEKELYAERRPNTSDHPRTTDEEGIAVFDRIDPDRAKSLVIAVHSAGHESRTRTIPWDGRAEKTVTISVPGAAERTLIVRTAEGPLEEGFVILAEEFRNWLIDDTGAYVPNAWEPDARAASIGPGGRATFHSPKWPKYAVVVSPRIGARLIEPARAEGTAERTIVVAPGRRRVIRFVDPEGRPLQGVCASVRDHRALSSSDKGKSSPVAGPRFTAVTGADGRLTIPYLEVESPQLSKLVMGMAEVKLTVEKSGWRLLERKPDDRVTGDEVYAYTRDEPERRQPMRIAIAGAETPPTLVLRAERFRGGSEKEEERIDRFRAETLAALLAEGADRAAIVARAEARLREFDLDPRRPATYFVVSEGRWPSIAISRLFTLGGFLSADILHASGCARTLVWGLVPKELGDEETPERMEPVEILLHPPQRK